MRKSVLSALAVLLLLATACRHPEIEVTDFSAAVKSFDVLSVKSTDVIVDGALNPAIRTMDGGLPETKVAEVGMTELVKTILESSTSRKVVEIVGTYTGRDIDYSPITLSGKVVLPASGPIKNMILVSHYTVGANFEAPSESFPLEAIIATKGYAMVFADYIGFGVTRDRIHPYMHVESTAQSVVDMGLAVKPYLEAIGRKPESDEVILLGYSQGGSTTLGVMNILQQVHMADVPIKKVYAGGGPYDLAATFDVSILEDLTGIPCAVPMIVQGVNEGEHLGLNVNRFFKPVLQEHFDEWVNSKEYTVHEINELLGARAVSDIMSDVGRDKKDDETQLLYRALMHNSVLNFTPYSPVYIFHSTEDDTVPFVNGAKAEMYFKGKDVTYDFGPYGKHSAGAIRFVLNVFKEL